MSPATASARAPAQALRAAAATAAPLGLALRKQGKESKRKNEYIDLGSKMMSNPNPRAKGGGYSPSAANTAGHRCAEKSRAAARRGAAQRGSAARRPGRRRHERVWARGTAAKPLDGGALPHGRSARAGEGVDGGASHASSAVAMAVVSVAAAVLRGERKRRVKMF